MFAKKDLLGFNGKFNNFYLKIDFLQIFSLKSNN